MQASFSRMGRDREKFGPKETETETAPNQCGRLVQVLVVLGGQLGLKIPQNEVDHFSCSTAVACKNAQQLAKRRLEQWNLVFFVAERLARLKLARASKGKLKFVRSKKKAFIC